LNEDDVLPVQLTRIVSQDAKLLRARKGRLLATKRARELLGPDRTSDLFRDLLETSFWRINLAYFDRVPVNYWPAPHIGVVLWSLSVAAHSWTEPEALVATCTMPEASFSGRALDFPSFALVARVLRPLTWFGMMERSPRTDSPPHLGGTLELYRKTPLFDEVLSFDVRVRRGGGSLQ